MVGTLAVMSQEEIAAAWERLQEAQERFERVRAEAAGMVAVAGDERAQAARELARRGATHREIASFLGLSRGRVAEMLSRQ